MSKTCFAEVSRRIRTSVTPPPRVLYAPSDRRLGWAAWTADHPPPRCSKQGRPGVAYPSCWWSITALEHTSDRVRALDAGADDYMSKPVDRTELVARVRSALRLKRVYDSLDSAEQVVYSLAAAVEAKDPYTEAHTLRVAERARRIGARMGLSPEEQDVLYRGGIIHDIGKIGVPDSILLKPGQLDYEERVKMNLHPIIGDNIVAPLQSSA